MSELDLRKQAILNAIIIEYVTAAEPIASDLLVQKYSLGVKSATIRNEMAEMADMGYLEQPHTSAGRIPSDRAYRYFVDNLILQGEIDDAAKQRIDGAADQGDALQSLLRDTARALSRVTHLLTAATTVRDAGVTVRNALVTFMAPAQALLVFVLSTGRVENRIVECPPGLSVDDVGRANEAMQSATLGKSLRALSRAKPPVASSPGADQLLSAVWPPLRALVRELTRGLLITEGEEFMFAQPEFQRDVGLLNELLDHLTDSDLLYESLTPGDQGQLVTIGKENRHSKMHALSVVRHNFFVGDSETGLIAIIGPTRMKYDSSIPLVRYTANALSECLTRFFG